MKTTSHTAIWLLTSLACFLALPVRADPAPQTPEQLKPMLKITWFRGVDLPQGFQDSEGGFIGLTLVTTTGFCSGVEADNLKKPGRYPRGFLTKTWGLDLAAQPAPPQQWQPLPDFPGAARQAMLSARINDQLYLWGGISYSAPFCYRDGWRLSKRAGTKAGGATTWTCVDAPARPADLHWQLPQEHECRL